ncbi:lupus La protein [Enteropsectra breve]|nr:lupus La protein [Enteropsectra breve]
MSIEKIKEQVEFYFSDSNYVKDKFLLETANKNDNKVPISTLLTFKRLQALGATLENVKTAMRDSKVAEVVEDSLKKIETPEYLEYVGNKDLNKRILYMKGFDKEMDLDEIKEYLKEYCSPIKILMRRDKTKAFKGTAFVEFATDAEVAKVLEMKIPVATKEADEEVKRVKTEDSEFIHIQPKDSYIEEAKARPTTKDTEKFANKVKDSFKTKLFRYETEKDLTIEEVKGLVARAAFVDVPKKIIRMEYEEKWTENEFENKENKIKLTKLSDEEATEYVSHIKIKKMPKKK